MDTRPSRWSCQPYEPAAALRLAGELGLSRVAATVLARRGLTDPEEARRFLAAAERHDPLSIHGMARARDAILGHVERGSPVAVHGDYDVDGVCSTAILVRGLRRLGARVAWELPSRFGDGYGLSRAAVERLAAAGAGLLVTVDCGITAVEEVAAARAVGLEVVVTDHHRAGERLPDCTVVHPGLGGYGCAELCAAGVALKLVEALYAGAGVDPSGAEDDLDLAALATVCDLVPLCGENRRIVRQGLAALRRTAKPGLRALLAVAGVEAGEADEHALGFRLGPRLNAAGRMQRADAALELLMSEDGKRAEQVARELDLLNRDRQEAETRILFEADAACEAQASAAAMVVAGEGWHPGVVGIVAARLVERWGRPCVAVALDGELGRGSGRSIGAYDLHAGLSACASHLRRFGGHRVAAGLEIAASEVPAFRSALAAHAAAVLSPDDLIPVEPVDAVVPGGALGLPLAEELEGLRPFGPGNPQPTLLVPAARVEGLVGMGEERRHARFTVVTGGSRSRCVAFGSPPRALAPAAEAPHHLAVRLEPNRWNGTVEPRLVLRAICPARPGRLRALGEDEPFLVRLERELEAPLAAPPAPRGIGGQLIDRRHEGFAGVVGDLLSSGARVLVALADVPRRRAALEQLVAGMAPEGLDVASWTAVAARAAAVDGVEHLVAFDPPPRGAADPLLARAPLAHLAWGAPEVEFALAVWRAELDLRPALVDAWRALEPLGEAAGPQLESALRGRGAYPRSAECCGRLLRVLLELRLAEYHDGRCRVRRRRRVQLERSPAYRAYRERLAAIERALAPEAPARAPAA